MILDLLAGLGGFVFIIAVCSIANDVSTIARALKVIAMAQLSSVPGMDAETLEKSFDVAGLRKRAE